VTDRQTDRGAKLSIVSMLCAQPCCAVAYKMIKRWMYAYLLYDAAVWPVSDSQQTYWISYLQTNQLFYLHNYNLSTTSSQYPLLIFCDLTISCVKITGDHLDIDHLSLETTFRFILSVSPILSRFTSSSTCQPISLIIPGLYSVQFYTKTAVLNGFVQCSSKRKFVQF